MSIRGARWAVLGLSLWTALPAWGWQARAAAGGLELVDDGAVLSRLELGEVSDVVWRGSVVYAALTSGGVSVVDASNPRQPRVVGQLAAGRSIAGLFLLERQLLVVENKSEVVAFSLDEPLRPVAPLRPDRTPPSPVAVTPSEPRPGPAAPAAAPSSPAPSSGAPSTARVLAVDAGRVVFDRGAPGGFVQGRRVRIVSQRPVLKPDLEHGGTREVPSGDVTGVLSIEHAESTRSMAPLGRGDAALPGDLATLTDEPLSERTWLPRRAPFSTRVGFHVRPFLGLATTSKPLALLADLYAAYYLENIPVRFEVAAAPVGTAFGGSDAHYPTTALLTAAYTTDYFEIGLGAGMLFGAPGPCTGGPLGADGGCEENTGLTINQVLRLGALDGLSVVWQSSIFSRTQAFVFGVGRGELNIPLTTRLGLFGAGGGGENGWAFGEFGVRTWVGGAGPKGTKIISASLGYAAVFDGRNAENVGGPLVAFGMEWRL